MALTFKVIPTRFGGFTVVGVFEGVEFPTGIEAPTAAKAVEAFLGQSS